jgi:hypothetical protein
MQSIAELTEQLERLTQAGFRNNLLARGLARGMIWSDGRLPDGSPSFSPSLTTDLLDHGYTVLGLALRLRTLDGHAPILDEAFRTAAEAIEAGVRRGESRDEERGFHVVAAAAAFHIAHLAARSYCLLEGGLENLNISSAERLLVHLMRRRLGALAQACRDWLRTGRNTDEGVAALPEDDDADFGAADAARTVVTRNFHRAIAAFQLGLQSGESRLIEDSLHRLDLGTTAAEQLRHVPLWWVHTLARHLLEDLWDRSLHVRIPKRPNRGDRWNALRRDFIDVLASQDLAHTDLWPSQLAAADRVVDDSDDLVVALPTSSGKTRIAELCILRCLSIGRRIVYVTPLRSLSAQVEISLAEMFRPLGFSVTSVYGASGIGAPDVETLRSADIVIATPEKLDFAIRQAPDVIDDVGLIVLDEGHMIGLSEREIRYEILVQRLLRRPDAEDRRLVCLSAIFSTGEAFDAFTHWIRSDSDGTAIRSVWRPTRQRPGVLEWQGNHARLSYQVDGEEVFVPAFVEALPPNRPRRTPFPREKAELVLASAKRFVAAGQAVLIYCPIRRSVESLAARVLKAAEQGYFTSVTPPGMEAQVRTAIRIGREWLGEEHVAVRALTMGVAVHHGQLPRPFLTEIERLLKRRILPIAISSPTLAQGVDLSFGVLLFNSLWRSGRVIPPKEFANVVGRVGRAFVDLDGIYVLPVLESSARAHQQRLGEFRRLIAEARERELESGLLQLISVLLSLISNRLGVGIPEAAEYIVNQQEQVELLSQGDEDESQLLAVVLAELDAGLLAMVDDLDASQDDIAARLDAALSSSYWQRRLAIRPVTERDAQRSVIQSRASWLWSHTDARQRRGFFAAGVGLAAGNYIVANAARLSTLLTDAEQAVVDGDAARVTERAGDLAAVLFGTYPFRPGTLGDEWPEQQWRSYINVWLTGRRLAEVADPDGIAFVQDGIVYRLVWGVEAARVTLESLGFLDSESDDVNGRLALCLTYGVPNITAALLLQAGLESRPLACRIVSELELEFTDRGGMQPWLSRVRAGGVMPPSLTEDEQSAWDRFAGHVRRQATPWRRTTGTYDVAWASSNAPEVGEHVRVERSQNGCDVMTFDFETLGTATGDLDATGVLDARINENRQVEVTRFGP